MLLLVEKSDITNIKFSPITRRRATVTIMDWLIAVAKVTGVSVNDLKSRSREETIKNARHLYCYMVYNYSGIYGNKLSFKQLSETIGRTHATALHSVRFVEDNLSINYYRIYWQNLILKVLEEIM